MEVRGIEVERDAYEDARPQPLLGLEASVFDGVRHDIQHEELLREHLLQLFGRYAEARLRHFEPVDVVAAEVVRV